MLHAFPLDHTMWDPQVAILEDRYHAITPDVPKDSPWSIDGFADHLNQLLDKEQVQDCIVVGLSLGGYIAIPFYAKYPQRVRKLVLADTRARADNDVEKSGRTEFIAALEQSGAAILPDRMLPRLLRPNAPPGVVQTVRHIMSRTTAQTAILALMAMRDRPDASTVLHRIACPTLVVVGEQDAVTRVEECRAMAETVRDGRFVTIPEAGHLSNLENAPAFNRVLTDFLGLGES
jgi:pimeloyl-ACP methyl ester carboxylesterase